MSNFASIRAVSFLWLGSILGAGCAFLTQVLLARKLGPAAFGAFSAALSTVTLVTPLAAFGIGGFWLRAFGEEGWQAMRWLRGSFRYTLMTTSVALAVLMIWVVLGPNDSSSRVLLTILSACLLGQVAVELVSAKLQLEERYISLAFWQFLPHLMRLVLLGILALGMASLMTPYGIASTYALVSFSAFAVGAVMIRRMYFGRFALKGHGFVEMNLGCQTAFEGVRKVANQSWPFGLAGVFHLVYFQSDIVILKYLIGDAAAGVFNVAFVIMVAVYMLPSVVYQKFLLPKIHRWAKHDRRKFYGVYYVGNRVMLGLGLVSMIVIWILSSWGVRFLFGSQYADSVFLLNVLALAAPIRFVATSVGSTLVTQNNMLRKVYCMGFTALINVLLNVFLIPVFGVLGAAISTVLSEFVLLATYFWNVKSVFKEDRGIVL